MSQDKLQDDIWETYHKTLGPAERFRPPRLNYLHKRIHELWRELMEKQKELYQWKDKTIIYHYPEEIEGMKTEELLPLHISLAEMTDNEERNKRIEALEPHIKKRILIMADFMLWQAERNSKLVDELIQKKRAIQDEIDRLLPEYRAETKKYSQQTKEELIEELLKDDCAFLRAVGAI